MNRSHTAFPELWPYAWINLLKQLINYKYELHNALEALPEVIRNTVLNHKGEELKGFIFWFLEDVKQEYCDIVHALVIGHLVIVSGYVDQDVLYLIEIAGLHKI